MLRYARCNIVILMAATAWLMLSSSSCIVRGFDSYTVVFKCTIKITMLHRAYLNTVTARLLTNYSNTLRNIYTNARQNITRTRAKRKAGYFFVAHPVYTSKYSGFSRLFNASSRERFIFTAITHLSPDSSVGCSRFIFGKPLAIK